MAELPEVRICATCSFFLATTRRHAPACRSLLIRTGTSRAPPTGTWPAMFAGTPPQETPTMSASGEHEPFEHGDVHHEPSELVKGVGKNARDVGVSTRHAVGHGGSEEGEV